MGTTNSMEICILKKAPVSTKRAPVRRLTGALFLEEPPWTKINLSPGQTEIRVLFSLYLIQSLY